MRRAALSLSVLLLGALLPGAAQAQEPQLFVEGPQPPVVTLGASTRIVLRVEGATQTGRPAVPEIAGATARLVGPERSERMFFEQGRIVRDVSVRWQIEITPARTGEFSVPSVAVPVGRSTLRSRPVTFEVVKEITGQQRAFLEVRPSATRLYVHEPLRFEIDYGIDQRLDPAQLRNGIYAIEILAPWLEQIEGAVPLETAPAGDMQLLLNGHVQRVHLTRDYVRSGQPFYRFQFTKAFLPAQIGTLDLPAPILKFIDVTDRGVGSIFSSGVETRTLFAYGEPLRIEVLPLPEEGRPTPYYGAVGRFRIGAELDRARVKVGNSVKLTVTIEGIGNTEFLRVPELDERAFEGFHLLGKTEKREPERVVVTYDLTPLSAEVDHVPAVAWNFFDTSPGAERYESVATEPLPLEVLPLAEGETLAPLAGEERRAVTPGVDDIFDMKPLDGEPALPPEPPPRAWTAAAIAAPWLASGLLAAALARRRRRRADVSALRARGARKRFARALARGGEPTDALVGYLADRLAVAEAAVIGLDLAARLRAAGVRGELADEVQRAVETGVAARYGGTGGVDESHARALVARLEGEAVHPARTGLVLLLCAALGALAPAARAQEGGDAAAAGAAAYRRGDYEAAARAFAEAAAGPDADGRLLYNLGNALFRSGRLGEALLMYERARRALPRDPELLANIRLVRARLELGTGAGEPFVDAVAALRTRFTSRELFVLCVLLHAAAAAALVLGRRRPLLRVLGGIALVPAVLLALELLWLGPGRPPKGIVIKPRAELVAEPRAGLRAVMTLREGVPVEVLAAGPAWTRIRVEGRSGYVPADSIGVVG